MTEELLVRLLFELNMAKRRTADKKGTAVTLLLADPGAIPEKQLREYGAACADELRLDTRFAQAMQMWDPDHFTTPTRC